MSFIDKTWVNMKKCKCIKTHISGKKEILENDTYAYSLNDNYKGVYNNKELVRPPITYSVLSSNYDNYTYLANDFEQHFCDIAELREKRINEILDL